MAGDDFQTRRLIHEFLIDFRHTNNDTIDIRGDRQPVIRMIRSLDNVKASVFGELAHTDIVDFAENGDFNFALRHSRFIFNTGSGKHQGPGQDGSGLAFH